MIRHSPCRGGGARARRGIGAAATLTILKAKDGAESAFGLRVLKVYEWRHEQTYETIINIHRRGYKRVC